MQFGPLLIKTRYRRLSITHERSISRQSDCFRVRALDSRLRPARDVNSALFSGGDCQRSAFDEPIGYSPTNFASIDFPNEVSKPI